MMLLNLSRQKHSSLSRGIKSQGGPRSYPAKFLNDFFSHLQKNSTNPPTFPNDLFIQPNPGPYHRTGPQAAYPSDPPLTGLVSKQTLPNTDNSSASQTKSRADGSSEVNSWPHLECPRAERHLMGRAIIVVYMAPLCHGPR